MGVFAIDTGPIERFITEDVPRYSVGFWGSSETLWVARLRNVAVAVSSLERFVLQSTKRDTKWRIIYFHCKLLAEDGARSPSRA